MTDHNAGHWDEEAEVIVVGLGGAGAAAALTAHDAGAKVLILEKQASDTPAVTNHTPNTRMCGGIWLCPTDVEAAVQYFEGMVKVANETLDDERKEIIRVLAENMTENDRWMKEMGVEWADTEDELGAELRQVLDRLKFEDGKLLLPDYPELPGAEHMIVRIPRTTGKFRDGAAVFKCFSESIANRNIPVLWQTPAMELVIDSGEVRGVIAQSGGKRLAGKAGRAVILSSGGFEFNEQMKENYLRVHPSHFYGSKANTGDGINMALKAGAALWHMNCASWRGVIKTPQHIFSPAPMMEKGGIYVDKSGSRFACEIGRGHAFGYDLTGYNSAGLRYNRIPFYWIFDEKRMQVDPLASRHGPCNPPGGIPGPDFYEWSKDNRGELEKGWFTRAATLKELAGKIAADPANQGMMSASILQNTVDTYNSHCGNGADPDFGRPDFTLTALNDPPYYAMKLWPGSTATHGGPKRNIKTQVVRPDNTPVPRLYSAGELGAFWGMLSTSGGGTGECYVSGRIAGANSAVEKRW